MLESSPSQPAEQIKEALLYRKIQWNVKTQENLSHTGDSDYLDSQKLMLAALAAAFLEKIKSVKELKQEIQAVVDSPDLERTDFSELWEEEED